MPRINEIHYDNVGADVGEFIEVRVPQGTDVTNMTVELYNGDGSVYDTDSVSSGTMTNDGTYDYYVLDISGIQNGAPDGMALVDNGTVVEFLSYEGVITATAGAANGMTSQDIGVAESSSTPVGDSLQRMDDGSWFSFSAAETPGAANAPCFTRGTRILCADGERSVETLRIGDQVITKDRGPQPIRWIGSRVLTPTFLVTRPHLRPVRISAGTFGAERDLVVSPMHAILVSDPTAREMFGGDEVLALAEHLVNGTTVTRETRPCRVEYFHLLFDQHEIIYSEGAATESFRPNCDNHHNWGKRKQAEIEELFPQLVYDHFGYGPAVRRMLDETEAADYRAAL